MTAFLERAAGALLILEGWCHSPRCPETDDLRVVIVGEPEAAAPLGQMSVLCRHHAEGLRP